MLYQELNYFHEFIKEKPGEKSEADYIPALPSSLSAHHSQCVLECTPQYKY